MKKTIINLNNVVQISPAGKNLFRVYFVSGRDILVENNPIETPRLPTGTTWVEVDVHYERNIGTGPL